MSATTRWKLLAASAAVGLAMIAASCASNGPSAPATTPSPVAATAAAPKSAAVPAVANKVKVETGVLVGETDATGVTAFRGVPFAAPPVGALRWKPPAKAVAWTGERDATKFGPACWQARRPGAGGEALQYDEDCLTLNVWRPAVARNAPVMVWIHGGSNLGGSGSIYNGAAFAKDGIVFVSVNYRLGAMGFFAHPQLTKASGPAEPLADYGLMDQTAALEWVQRNIAAFGGDPKQVTVFGESAGAIDIYALLGLKTSKGLFSKAILESNITWGESPSIAEAELDGAALIKRAGAAEGATLADMRAIPAEKLTAAASGALFPIVDKRFMTETSLQALARDHVVDVPLIVGTNSFEASLVAAQMKDPVLQTGWTNSQAGAPARYIAAKTSSGQPSWLYFFSYVATDRRATAPGAAHASEISYVYGGSLRPPAAGAPEPSAEDKAMAALMHSCWVAFAKTGEPKCASGPAWPKYTPAADQLMEFGAPESAVRTNFRKTELDAVLSSKKLAN